MNEALESRLRDAGMPCRVEARERLAILIPEGSNHDRQRLIQMARAEGFTHVCLELDPRGAPLPGD